MYASRAIAQGLFVRNKKYLSSRLCIIDNYYSLKPAEEFLASESLSLSFLCRDCEIIYQNSKGGGGGGAAEKMTRNKKQGKYEIVFFINQNIEYNIYKSG